MGARVEKEQGFRGCSMPFGSVCVCVCVFFFCPVGLNVTLFNCLRARFSKFIVRV